MTDMLITILLLVALVTGFFIGLLYGSRVKTGVLDDLEQLKARVKTYEAEASTDVRALVDRIHGVL